MSKSQQHFFFEESSQAYNPIDIKNKTWYSRIDIPSTIRDYKRMKINSADLKIGHKIEIIK